MSHLPHPDRPKLGALTGIRLPFALLVVLNHFAILYAVAAQRPDPNFPEFGEWCAHADSVVNAWWVFRGLVQGACVGLSMFFMLSGFILTYTYQGGVESQRIDRYDFFIARLARVYPLYALALLFSAPLFVVVVQGHQPPLELWQAIVMGLSAVVLLQSWWPASSTIWNPPGWSLSVEAFCYALFPRAVERLARMGRPALWAAIPVCWALMLIAPTAYHLTDPDGLGEAIWKSDGFWFRMVKHNPLLRVPEFLAGAIVGRLFVLRTMGSDTRPWRGRGMWLSTLPLVAIVAIMLYTEQLPYILMHNGLLLPLFAVMIYGLALGGGPIEWMLSRRPIVFLGDATYSMYLLHTALIAFAVVDLVQNKKYDTDPWAFMFWNTLIVTVISMVTYRWFEIPMRRRIRKWLLR